MTDEEIIKLLENCIYRQTSRPRGGCTDCLYCIKYKDIIYCDSVQRDRNILDMINRLKAENEKFKAEREAKLEKAFDHNEEECNRCMEKIEMEQNLLLSEVEERAYKKTAKEILSKIGKQPCEHAYLNSDCKWFERICKEYGVEVEE